jgi:hypothetical protein
LTVRQWPRRGSQPRRGTHDATRPRYGLLLITLLASYLLSALMRARWIGAVEVGLFTVAALLALRNSPAQSRATRLAVSAALVVSVSLVAISASIPTDTGLGLTSIWTTVLLLLTVLVLVRQILLMPAVTLQSIFGAVSAYLIIGMMYAAIYSASYYLNGRAFFAGNEPGDWPTFQYFSFATLTTLGYGDFVTIEPSGRAIAMIEAITGQIFLATLVARLVAAFRPASLPAQPTSADDADGPSD